MKYVILGLTAVTLMIAAYCTATAGSNCTTNCSRTNIPADRPVTPSVTDRDRAKAAISKSCLSHAVTIRE